MKKSLVIAFSLILLASFGLVSAGTCAESQSIFRLYGDSAMAVNSHYGNYNDSDYGYQVCYNEFFGGDYMGVFPHKCTGMNTLFYASSETNAHVSNISDAVYSIEVCYGNLQCYYDSSGTNDCSLEGEFEVLARAYSDYNSHLSYPDDSNYLNKICCTDTYWADMNGKIISSANVGDTVYLVAPSGSGTEFDIKERDVIFNDAIRNDIEGEDDGISVVAYWTITRDDLDKAGDYEEFFFEIGSKFSQRIPISFNSDDDDINITMVSPICGRHFNESSNISVDIFASDSDDKLTGTVTLVNSAGEEINSTDFTNGGTTFDYTFTIPGEYQIIGYASNTRGVESEQVSNIMILDMSGAIYVDGTYTAACLVSPLSHADYAEDFVNFDASNTRGIRVVGGEIQMQTPGTDKFIWDWYFEGDAESYGSLASIKKWADEDVVNDSYFKFTVGYPSSGSKTARLRVSLP